MLQNCSDAAVIGVHLDIRPWIVLGASILGFNAYESQIAGNTPKASLTCMSCAARGNHEISSVTTQTELRQWTRQGGQPGFGLPTISQRFQRGHVQLRWILHARVVTDDAEDIADVTEAAFFPTVN